MQELPLRCEASHDGFVLSQKDYFKAEEEPNMESILIKRQRNTDELQMKLVLPKHVREILSRVTRQTVLDVNIK